MTLTLANLGEFAVLDRLLPIRSAESGIGDDCYHFPFADGFLAITADPGPTPLVGLLGPDWHDMSVWGWYAATANASDLAAAAAKPLFMTNCVFAKPDMPVSDLEMYFTGYNAALQAFGFTNAGGDLSSGDNFRSVCTAVGWVAATDPLRRSGCSPGDILACVGTCGNFASAFLQAMRVPQRELSDETIQTLRRPNPKIREIQLLRAAGRITSASDASDGLLGGIWNIAESSTCGFHLALNDDVLSDTVQEEAQRLNINPWNLFSFWGDWQVIITFPESELDELARTADTSGIPLVVLGRACSEPTRLTIDLGGARYSINLFRNEHFSPTSYYLSDVDQVIKMMRRPIFRRA